MIRTLLVLMVVVSGVFLSGAVAMTALESTWTTPERTIPLERFLYGSTGTELMPLPVFQVLPDLFPDQFLPGGPEAGDWVDQFGFIRGKAAVNEGLPLGMNVSRYRPKSGAPSPVPFVGFNCAVCHTARIRRSENEDGTIVYGMANANLDLVAFGEAIKTSILDEKRFTVDRILDAYNAKFHQPLGVSDKVMISLWLQATREALHKDLPLRDWPYGGADIRNSDLVRGGPGRNEPMTETVRFLINRTPPRPGGGASKIPCIYHQGWREWAQFDGSLKDPLTRNSLAALGVGASLQNLRVPGILGTLRTTSEYVRTLDGPKYRDVFRSPDTAIDLESSRRGSVVYRNHCGNCHGWPGNQPNEWVKGSQQGKVVPAEEIGTDSARVRFRYYDRLAQTIYDFFPVGHPLKPKRSDLRPNPGDPLGFISQPIESVFSRAPYLHNGSVPTLAELINLKPRRAVFYRGSNLYDPIDVGLVAPSQPDAKRYFRYDTSLYGNFNRGHDYPWKYKGSGWNEHDLKDLLEYLKTL